MANKDPLSEVRMTAHEMRLAAVKLEYVGDSTGLANRLRAWARRLGFAEDDLDHHINGGQADETTETSGETQDQVL